MPYYQIIKKSQNRQEMLGMTYDRSPISALNRTMCRKAFVYRISSVAISACFRDKHDKNLLYIIRYWHEPEFIHGEGI